MKIEEFKVPPKSARPMVRWWWPGIDVNREELIREVGDLDQAGFGGGELQPFAIGLDPKMVESDPERAKRVHRFMQPYHYEMMQCVIEEAAKRNLIIDITQNSSWPTGGTHITREDSHKTLLFSQKVVNGDGTTIQTIQIPPLKKPSMYTFFQRIIPKVVDGMLIMHYIPEDKKLIKIIAGKLVNPRKRVKKFSSWKVKRSVLVDKESLIDLSDKILPSGHIQWQVPLGTWQIFAFYEGAAGANALADARSAPGKESLVVDHFNKDAVVRHLEAFLGQGRAYFGNKFGTTFRAFFTDSFELVSPWHWKIGFLQEFRKRRGYDITPYLPICYIPLKDIGYYTYGSEIGLPSVDIPGDLGGRIRYDFQKTISELFVDEFIKGIQAWAKQNKLLSRMQGYGMLADPLMMQGYSDIPETEQLYTGGMVDFLKLTGSATTLYSHTIATAESMVWMKRDYMTTPLKWRVAADKLFESGINQMIYHGFPYQSPGTPYPGLHPFSSPHAPTMTFSENHSRENPFWKFYPIMNAYVSRLQYLLQRSKTLCKIGIYYGLFDYPNGYYKKEELTKGVLDEFDTQMPPDRLTEIVMPTKIATGDREHITEMATLGDKLVANGYYYAHINEDRILAATIKEGKLCIGDAELEALIFVNETQLSLEIVKKLELIITAGIPVIFRGKVPTHQPGYLHHDTNDPYIAQSIQTMGNKLNSICASDDDVIKYLRQKPIESNLRYPLPRMDLGFIFKQDRQNQFQYLFIRNRKDRSTSVELFIPSMKLVPYIFDAWRGECYIMPNFRFENNGVKIEIKLESYASMMIGFGTQEIGAKFSTPPELISIEQGQNFITLPRWTLSLQERNIDGTFREIHQEITQLDDWRKMKELKYCAGPAKYTCQFKITEQELMQFSTWILKFQRVYDVAEIIINNHDLPILLVPPWQCQIEQYLKVGNNTIDIVLYTTIRNRLVGYGNSGDKRYRQFKKALTAPTGLIGPILLVGTNKKSD